MCILTVWLKTSHTMCLCSAYSYHLHAIHDVCLIVCWLRPRSVLDLFLSVVYLFSSLSYLYSEKRFISNVNSVEGINHCAFAQWGVLHHGDLPSSHMGKPPSFDGNDAEYQDFLLQLLNPHGPRQHSVSTVYGQMRCRTKSDIPGSRASAGRYTLEVLHTDVLLVGFDHQKGCPNSCPICWRIQWSRGMASDTQQTCSRHSESTVRFDTEDYDACESLVWPRWRFWIGLESLGAGCRRIGTRFWICVGRCSPNTQWSWIWHRLFLGTICSWVPTLTVPLFEQLCCNVVILPEALKQIRLCQLEMEQMRMMTTGYKSIPSRKARGRAKANTKTRKEIARDTRATQTSTRARTVAERDIGRKTAGCWRPDGRACDNSTSYNSNTQKGKKRISLLKQSQPCRIPHKHWVQFYLFRPIQTWNRKVGSWVWQSIPCLPQGDKLVQSICFLTVVHSFTHVRSGIQDKKIPLPATHTVSGARLQHDWWLANFQKDSQFERFSTRVQFRNPSCVLVVSLSRGTGVIFVQTLVHCSFLTRSRRNTAKLSCTRNRVCSLSKACWLRLCRQLVWVTKSLKSHKCRLVCRCWKTLRSRCLLVLRHSEILALAIKSWWNSTVWHSFRVSPGARCASNPEDVIHHIKNRRKSMQLCLNFSLTTGWVTEPLKIACSPVGADTSSGAIHATMVPDSKKMDMPYVVSSTATWLCDGVYHSTQKNNDMTYSQLISDLSTYVKNRAQRSDDSIFLRHMDDVVGTGPGEHLKSDVEHMKTSLYLTDVVVLRHIWNAYEFVWTEHLTRVFSRTFVHSSFAHMHLHGSRCCRTCLVKTFSSACHHVSDRSLSLHPLNSSSLSSVSTSCPIFSLSLFCSSSSMSELPSNKSLVHPENEEYGPVAIHNPLTGYEPKLLDDFGHSETSAMIFQDESGDIDTEPS